MKKFIKFFIIFLFLLLSFFKSDGNCCENKYQISQKLTYSQFEKANKTILNNENHYLITQFKNNQEISQNENENNTSNNLLSKLIQNNIFINDNKFNNISLFYTNHTLTNFLENEIFVRAP